MTSAPKWTQGPLKVVLDGTMTGVWAEIRQECIDPNEDNRPWERVLARTNTAYVRRADAYPADNSDSAGFRPFEEAHEQFELTEDGKEAIANAYLWAAASDMAAALRDMIRLADMGLDESLGEPEENGNYAAYNRAAAALAKAEGKSVGMGERV